MKGYYGIGVYHTKTEANIGTLWRSAYIFGASFIFTIGKRYKRQRSDTCKTWNKIPLYHYTDLDDFKKHIPFTAMLIGIETSGEMITKRYSHPLCCIYLLGAEDQGLPEKILKECNRIIRLPGKECMNVATAGSIIMYDRYIKEGK